MTPQNMAQIKQKQAKEHFFCYFCTLENDQCNTWYRQYIF